MKKVIIAIIIVGVGYSGYTKWQARSGNGINDYIVTDVSKPGDSVKTLKLSPPSFRCDGRQYCSQMTSRAEAEYFTRNCPDTKMDGDHDGIPCENDSRF